MNSLFESGAETGEVITAGSSVQIDLNTMVGFGFHAKAWQLATAPRCKLRSRQVPNQTPPSTPRRSDSIGGADGVAAPTITSSVLETALDAAAAAVAAEGQSRRGGGGEDKPGGHPGGSGAGESVRRTSLPPPPPPPTLHWEWFEECGKQGTWRGTANQHRYYLYASTLAVTYNKVFTESPGRLMVVLNHFCLSGGMSHFLRKRQWREYVGTALWPIYCMVTCDDFEASVGGFWGAWIAAFVDASRHPTRGDTLSDVYRAAEHKYWEKNKGIGFHNATAPPAQNRKEPVSFGTVAAYQGSSGMADLPCWDMLYGGVSAATLHRRQLKQQRPHLDVSVRPSPSRL